MTTGVLPIHFGIISGFRLASLGTGHQRWMPTPGGPVRSWQPLLAVRAITGTFIVGFAAPLVAWTGPPPLGFYLIRRPQIQLVS